MEQSPTYEEVIRKAGVSDENVLGLYLHGSFLYGTYTSDSDYDFILIVNERVGPLAVPESPHAPHHSAEVVVRFTLQCGREADVTVIIFEYWESLLLAHTVRLLLAQWQPQTKKLKEIAPCPVNVDIDLMTLKFEVYGYSQRHCDRIRVEMKRGNKRDSFKMCMNVLRVVLCGTQIALGSRTLQFDELKDIYHDGNARDFQNYEDLMQWFNPIYDERMEAFKLIVNPYKLYDSCEVPGQMETSVFLQRYSPELLTRHFSVSRVSNHDGHASLVAWHAQKYSPALSRIATESTGLVLGLWFSDQLDASANWRAVSFGVPLLYDYDEDSQTDQKFVPAIKWAADVKVYEMMNGIQVSLFYYDAFGINLLCRELCKTKSRAPLSSMTELVRNDFWRIWKLLGLLLPDEFQRTQVSSSDDEKSESTTLAREMGERCKRYNFTFILNIVSEMMELMSVRDMDSLLEIPSQPVASLFGWPHLPSVPFKFLPDFLKIPEKYFFKIEAIMGVLGLNPCEKTGLMICDSNWNRVLVPSRQHRGLENLNICDGSNKMVRMLMVARALCHTSYPNARQPKESPTMTNDADCDTATHCSSSTTSPEEAQICSNSIATGFRGGDEEQFARTFPTFACWFQHANSFLIAFCNKINEMMQTVIPPHFFTDPSLHIQPQSAPERDALNQRIDETLQVLAEHFRESGGLTTDITGTLRGIFLAIAAENGKVDSYGYYTDPVGLHKPKRKSIVLSHSYRAHLEMAALFWNDSQSR